MNVKCEKFQQSNQNMDLAESELLIWRGPQLPGGTGGHLSSWKNYHYTVSSDLQKTDRLDIGYLPFEWPLEADDEDEDDVGSDPKDAEAGQQEGGHLLVLRAQEPRLSGESEKAITCDVVIWQSLIFIRSYQKSSYNFSA